MFKSSNTFFVFDIITVVSDLKLYVEVNLYKCNTEKDS